MLSKINEIIQNLETEENTTAIWCGDFNLFFDVQLDADGGSPKLKLNSVCRLLRNMSENDLCDVYRLRFPYEKRFTWRCKIPFKQRRLVYFLISDSLQDLVNATEIIPSVQSDHSALKMKMSSLTEGSKGPSYWKFNNTLILHDEYVNNMKSKIPEFYRESLILQDPVSRWEFLKYRMRQYSMKVAKQKTRDGKGKMLNLEQKVKSLELKICSKSSEELLQEYNKSKNELDTIYDYITEGIILRSKVNWYEHGEQSSRYFLNLEKRNKARSFLKKVSVSNGTISPDPDEILSAIRTFIQNCIKKQSTKTKNACLSYLANFKLPRLMENERVLCEGKLTKRKCWEALVSMGNNKSPENDGFTKEFYVCFFDELHR